MCTYSSINPFRFQFKATRLNREIFTRGGLYGVPTRKTEAPLTIPASPHLATRERMNKTEEEVKEEKREEPVFVARPVPKAIFEKVKVCLMLGSCLINLSTQCSLRVYQRRDLAP